MRSAIPDRERWMALALLVLALGVAYLVLVHPWWTRPMLELGDRIEALKERDQRARMVLAQQPQVTERFEKARAEAEGVPGFMAEGSLERAAASLTQHLESAVSEASPGNRSCAIVNRSPMTDAGQRFPRAVVRVRMRCGIPELAAVLHSLEGGSPRLFVDNLNLLTEQYLADPAGPQRGVGLDVSFDLIGYVRPLPAGGGDAD